MFLSEERKPMPSKFPIPMRGNEHELRPPFGVLAPGFPIPMRGNERKEIAREGRAHQVPDPYEG